MQKYQYKNSDIEWIGDIPEHWKITKIKNEFRVIPSNVDKKIHDSEDEVKLCNYVDVYYNDYIKSSIDFMIATATDNEIKKFNLLVDDIIITKDSEDPFDIAVPALVKETSSDLLCGYHLSFLRSVNNKILGAFLFWSLKDDSIVSQLHREATGITRWAISSRNIKNSIFPFPPYNEQKAIAQYLNNATAKIDKIIELKEKQLKKLELYFKSKIHETVTKGFPNTSPKEWKETRLKSLSLDGLTNGIFKKNDQFGSGVKLVNVTDLYTEDNLICYDALERVICSNDEVRRFSAKDGDIFFVRSSLKLEGIGVSSLLEDSTENHTVFECHIIRFRPYPKFVNPKFLKYILNSVKIQGQFVAQSKTVTMTTIAQNSIASIKLTIPSLDTQKRLANYLDLLAERVYKSKTIISKQIETLKSYRKSLIHECVTGKKQIYKGEKIN